MRASTQRNIARAGSVFTIVDAGMTAGFGWLASSAFVMKPILAAGLGALSFTLAFLPVVAVACMTKFAQTRARAWLIMALLITIVYVGGFIGNFFSNYGLSAALFKGNVIQAQNKNQDHADKRSVVERLRQKNAHLLGVIGTPGTWMSSTDAEKALERTIAARDREGARVKCGPKCEALDARAREMRLELGKAKAREKAIADQKDVAKQLAVAEKAAEGAPKHISVAASQAEYLARIFSQSLKPSNDTVDWTLMGTSICISLFISIFAHLCNLIPALNLANVAEEPEPEYAKQSWLAPPPGVAPQPVPPRPAAQPYPLHAAPAPPPSRAAQANPDADWRNGLDALDRVLARAEARRVANA